MNYERPLTCLTCRRRKVKCDGVFPECGCCRRGKNLECQYGDGRRPIGRRHLQKGQACDPCRIKKRKCNATRPACDACIANETECQCKYTYIDRSSTAPPAGTGVGRLLSVVKPSQDIITEPRILHPSTSSSSTSGFDNSLCFENSFSLCSERSFSLPPNGALNEWACSNVSLEDMNMSLRLTFLAHRYQLGFYIPVSKHQAIVLGDLSGIFLNKFFVNFSHVSGANFYYKRDPCFRFMFMLGVNIGLSWQALLDVEEQGDTYVLAQACYCMFVAFMHTGNPHNAKCYLRKAVSLAHKHRIRFLMETDGEFSTTLCHPLQYSEEAHERSAFLARLIHSETVLQLTTAEVWNKTSDLELEFRTKLPMAHPVLFKICPIILSTRSILFVKDVQNLIALHGQLVPPSNWATQSEQLLHKLTSHISDIILNAAGPFLTFDNESRVSVDSSIIICLTAKVELCILLAKHPISGTPSPTIWENECDIALRTIVSMTSQMTDDDLDLADPFLSTSWSSIIEILNERSPSSGSSSSKRVLNDGLFAVTHAKAKLYAAITTGPVSLCQRLAEMNYKSKPARQLLRQLWATFGT